MGRAAKREHLHRTLHSHALSIRDTFQLLDQPAAAPLEKTEWSEVLKLADEISKQATVCGMLSSGSTPEMREMEEHIGAYCNLLLGFLLMCQGSTVGAGHTLLACIRALAEKVIDHSLSLMQEAVSSYGSTSSERKTSIAHLSGKVWESCTAIKKCPTTNSMAVTRALIQIGVSIKDVLRELRELQSSSVIDSEDDELTSEEREIAELGIEVVASALGVVKESMRFTGSGSCGVDAMEEVLRKLRVMGEKVDDFGASVFPPQEMEEMAAAAGKMVEVGVGLVAAVGRDGGGLVEAVDGFVGLLRRVEEVVGRNEVGVEREISALSL